METNIGFLFYLQEDCNAFCIGLTLLTKEFVTTKQHSYLIGIKM